LIHTLAESVIFPDGSVDIRSYAFYLCLGTWWSMPLHRHHLCAHHRVITQSLAVSTAGRHRESEELSSNQPERRRQPAGRAGTHERYPPSTIFIGRVINRRATSSTQSPGPRKTTCPLAR
jgi:hypothetical protein